MDPASCLRELLARRGNTVCADCSQPRPRYASTSFGVFICDECFGSHRSAGTHVSRTKSVSLDSWSPADLAAMQRGNVAVNAELEARLPVRRSSSSFGSREERNWFIVQKYERKKWYSPNRVSDGLDRQKDVFWPHRPSQPACVAEAEPPDLLVEQPSAAPSEAVSRDPGLQEDLEELFGSGPSEDPKPAVDSSTSEAVRQYEQDLEELFGSGLCITPSI